MSEALTRLRELVEDVEADITRLEQSKATLEEDIRQLSGQKTFIEGQIADVNKQLEQEKVLYESVKAKRQAEISRMDQAAQDISKQIVQLTDKKLAAEQVLINMEEERDRKCAQFDRDLEQRRSDLTVLAGQITAAERELAAFEGKTAEAQEELDKLDKQFKVETDSLEAELKDIRTSITEAYKQLQQYQADAKTAQEEHDRLTVQNGQLIQENEALAKREAEFDERQKQVRKELDARQDSLDEREKALAQKIALSKRRTSALD